jgi:membrane associated rhomboid family serine protease
MIWLLPWDKEAGLKHTPWATWMLVGLNVVAFVMMLLSTGTSEEWITTWGLSPNDPHWYQYLTSDFVHAGVLHLFFNMVFLLVFGDQVEDAFGPAGLLLLYFLGGFAGDFLFVDINSTVAIPSVGASGCISALAGAYGALFLTSTIGVRVFLLVFPLGTWNVPAFLVLLFYFGSDVLQTFSSHGVMESGGTNFVAHGIGLLVGLAAGMLAIVYGVRRRYEQVEDGDPWFGYWPSRLDDAPRRRRGARPMRERPWGSD